ncbi:MAG: rhomboid family intramembrane serine protease [Acidimicrobiia bacterium]|nr:rhomboid family intramembrane serine protease [Acidimicrobiia bacterium]
MNVTRSNDWYITYALIGANVLVFIVGLAMGDTLIGSSATDGLTVEAATWGSAIDLNNEWWRVFTGGFLHHGMLHLAVNMVSLYILGCALEQSLGRWQFVAVYFASLLGGSFGALLDTPNALIAGASGAIFGLMGALVTMFLAQGVGLFQTPVGPILGINLLISFTVDDVSLGGHLGGLIAGSLVGIVATETWRRQKYVVLAPLLIGLFVGAGSFVGALWAATRWV